MSKTLTVVPQAAPLSEAQHKHYGEQLTAHYQRSRLAMLEVVAFGAMFLQVEAMLDSEAGIKGGQTSARARRDGSGFKGWLKKYAPEIEYTKARRYRDIAEAVATRLSLKGADQLQALSDSGGKLSAADAKKRAKLIDLVSDKSVHGLQLQLGLRDQPQRVALPAGSKAGSGKSSPEMTQAQRSDAFKAAARERALNAFNELHTLEDRWQFLTFDEIDQAVRDMTKLLSRLEKWREMDAGKRMEAVAATVLNALGK